MEYCSHCGAKVAYLIPEGDNRKRHVCPHCQSIHYSNPKIIVGSLPLWENQQVLLCRRAIEPRCGLWTLPSGFMENGETSLEGAVRETREEANANIQIDALHTLFDIPHINQVYLLFKARLLDLDFSPGLESLEVKLFVVKDIPWDELAFHAVKYCLECYKKEQDRKETHTVYPNIHYASYPSPY